MTHKYSLLAALAALSIAAGEAWAQYVEDSIDVGGRSVYSMVYNSHDDVLYGASMGGIFFVISCDSNKVVMRLSLGAASEVAYDSTHNKVYCTYGPAEQESLAVIDGRTYAVLKTLSIPGAWVPVWDPISDGVYVSCYSVNKVAVVNGETDSLVKYVPVGAWPRGVYLNAVGRRLYVQNLDAGTVSIVDLATDSVIKTINVGSFLGAGYYCQASDKFYTGVICECVVIGGQTDTIVARVQLPGNAEVNCAAGSGNGELVYLGVSDGGPEDYVAIMSTADDSLRATTTVPPNPAALACQPGSGLVYCARSDWLTGYVFVLSSDGTQVLDTLQVGWGASVFAQAPRHGRLYLGHSNTRYLYVLRDTSSGVSEQQSRPRLIGALHASPNPFVRNVIVVMNLPTYAGNAVRVYAQDGSMVRQAEIPAGQSRWVWDGRDDSGAALPPGVYVIEAGPGLRAKVVKTR